MSQIAELIKRVERARRTDRDLDQDVATALGASIRRVTRLGLNGRTPGSYRAFFPYSDPRKGSAIPYYTKTERSRARAVALLRSMEADRG